MERIECRASVKIYHHRAYKINDHHVEIVTHAVLILKREKATQSFIFMEVFPNEAILKIYK